MAGLLVACAAAPASATGSEPAFASAWVTEQAARARVIAGGVPEKSGVKTYAGLEIHLEDGWKTYWRNPGSSGVPPRIEFDGSENLAKAELLFPAPRRFKDRDGDTIGYKSAVVLPMSLEPKDPTKPIMLRLAVEFGICREVCIPVQPGLSLVVPADAARHPPGDRLPAALARIPQPNAADASAPRLEQVTTTLDGAKPKIVIDAKFPEGASGGDLFLEAPDGLWMPLAAAAGKAPSGAHRFEVDLTDGADISDLKGRTIRVTLVSDSGQSEAAFDLVESR